MTKTNGLRELIEKIETDLKKIEEAKGILGPVCFIKKAKNREDAIYNLWKCTVFAETTDEFLANVDEAAHSISVEVRRQMDKYIKYRLRIRRKS